MSLIKDIENALKMSFENCNIGASVSVVYSARPELADFQCNSVFAASKELGVNPFLLAEKIVENIPQTEGIEFSVCKPAFINIKVSNDRLSAELNRRNEDKVLLGLVQEEKPQTVVMDYGGANVAKELHVGHLRSPIIGEALARLYRPFWS